MSAQLCLDEWLRAFTVLALRVDRLVAATRGGTVLDYRGPDRWRAQVAAEQPALAGRLVADCDALLDDVPVDGRRAAYLTSQVRSMRVVARRLDGERLPLVRYAASCLGVPVEWEPESTFEDAHDRLDRALPAGAGSLAARLRRWQQRHLLPQDQAHRLLDVARLAVAETRRRTEPIVPIPDDAVVDVRRTAGPHRGQYHGGRRSTIHLSDAAPFNLADLLYVVAHEGFPGHIAESLAKDLGLVARGHVEHEVRFMISPSFVVGEGVGLHAPATAFPGDEAQAWLTDAVLAPLGIGPDGSDFAAVHDARNALWGAWGNAALLAGEGRPDGEVTGYLRRWAVTSDDEAAWAADFFRTPGMDTYVLAYFHGWRLLRPFLDHPDRLARTRRLLAQAVLPGDLTNGAGPVSAAGTPAAGLG